MTIIKNIVYNMYTDERNIQIVIALLKAHGIRYVVASPGTMNASFVTSIQDDADFEVFSCVDERSAAYMACGIAAEKGEPVVLSCTGATASRNYFPGLTEAYYRKLPILAITSLSTRWDIGQNIAQQLDRSVQPKDLVVESVYLPLINDKFDERTCEREANKAILSLWKNGGGPVHIDLASSMSLNKIIKLPQARVVRRYTSRDEFPAIPNGCRIGIMVGVHPSIDGELTQLIDQFCSTYDAIVYSVNPKSYTGKFAANVSLLFAQFNYGGLLNKPDLLISIGEVTTDAVGFCISPKENWRISEDGELRDHYKCLTKVFQMTEKEFFAHYAPSMGESERQLNEWEREDAQLRDNLPELPFSNAWIAQTLENLLPENAELYLGILNSIRAWDYANPSKDLRTNANVGGFGIDGCISTMIGASIVAPEKQFFGIFGDLAFFYDMNILGNRHIGQNVHLLIVNNDGGQQFRNDDHPMHSYGVDVINPYVAAIGHNGAKSKELIRNYAQALGMTYISASNKEEFVSNLPQWLATGKSVVYEVFTEEKDEEIVFSMLRSILGERRTSPQSELKRKIKKVIGAENAHQLKKMLGL